MRGSGRVHDRAILDALDALDPVPFQNNVYRVTRKGRDPLRGSAAGGRWSPPGEFEVLYTSLVIDGALAEIGFRLGLEPVWPSRLQHEIHHLVADVGRVLRFADVSALERLGVDVTKYANFDYSATQQIAAAAHFLGFDGLLVPSARFDCPNLVVFLDETLVEELLTVVQSDDIDWDDWQKRQRKKGAR